MKSEYYLATVINAYRRCIDFGFTPVIERELLTAAHRDYTTAYMLGENSDTVNYTDSQTKGDCDYVANKIRAMGVENIHISNIGPVIGAHTGPGAVALFFSGDVR